MDNKIITLQKIDGIYDIQAMITPALSAFEFFVLITLFFIFAAGNIYLLWRVFFSRRAKCKREIIKLKHKYTQNIITPHDAAYKLCQILRVGLKQKQLNINTPPPKNFIGNKDKWKPFIIKLSDSRYKENPDTLSDMHSLFNESLLWLKR